MEGYFVLLSNASRWLASYVSHPTGNCHERHLWLHGAVSSDSQGRKQRPAKSSSDPLLLRGVCLLLWSRKIKRNASLLKAWCNNKVNINLWYDLRHGSMHSFHHPIMYFLLSICLFQDYKFLEAKRYILFALIFPIVTSAKVIKHGYQLF